VASALTKDTALENPAAHQRVLRCLTGLFTPSLVSLASIESTV
jgi:hypothetical protein